MATALEIANEAILSLGLKEVDTLVGGSEEGKRLRVHMNRGGQALLSQRGTYGQGWPQATKFYEFTTVLGRSFYPLPADFVSLVPRSVWDISLGWEAAGPVTPYEDALLQYGYVSAVVGTTAFKQDSQGGQTGLTLYPDPGNGTRIACYYNSSHWVKQTEQAEPTGNTVDRDSDVPIFPPHLVSLDVAWRYTKSLGKDADLLLGEFELERDRQFGQVSPRRTIRLGGPDEMDLSRIASPAVLAGRS